MTSRPSASALSDERVIYDDMIYALVTLPRRAATLRMRTAPLLHILHNNTALRVTCAHKHTPFLSTPLKIQLAER